MHAKLIITKSAPAAKKHIQGLAKQKNALVLKNPILKIADSRALKQSLKLKSNKAQIYFIPEIDNATIEAQNSLLKTIEEPSQNSFFALTARNKNAVLPTIISRCELIFLNQPDNKNYKKAKEFLKSTTPEKLQKTSKITNRQDAIKFVNTLLDCLAQTQKKSPKTIDALDSLNKTLENLKKNTNTQLTLTQMVISLE